VVVAKFKVLSWHLPGGTEDNHETLWYLGPINLDLRGTTFGPLSVLYIVMVFVTCLTVLNKFNAFKFLHSLKVLHIY
jgi:hypothetical protein